MLSKYLFHAVGPVVFPLRKEHCILLHQTPPPRRPVHCAAASAAPDYSSILATQRGPGTSEELWVSLEVLASEVA